MTHRPRTVAAVILAAGASSRMGSPKALLDAGAGESFLDRLAGAFLASGCTVYAVLGEDATLIAKANRRGAEITFVLNPDPSRGQLSSLQCGLRAAAGADAIFFTPVDAPGVACETIRLLLEFLTEKDFVIPIYEGQRGHPVLLRAGCAEAFLNPPEGASARDILHARRTSTRFVEVADPGILEDIDDPAAYERWRAGVLPRNFSTHSEPLPHGPGSGPEPCGDTEAAVGKRAHSGKQNARSIPGGHPK